MSNLAVEISSNDLADGRVPQAALCRIMVSHTVSVTLTAVVSASTIEQLIHLSFKSRRIWDDHRRVSGPIVRIQRFDVLTSGGIAYGEDHSDRSWRFCERATLKFVGDGNTVGLGKTMQYLFRGFPSDRRQEWLLDFEEQVTPGIFLFGNASLLDIFIHSVGRETLHILLLALTTHNRLTARWPFAPMPDGTAYHNPPEKQGVTRCYSREDAGFRRYLRRRELV
jgi:hypothetical protein